MKRLLTIALLCVCGFALKAQQTPMYSQFLFHDYLINPAIAGTKEYYDVKMTQRLQWVGMEDAPRTSALSVNGPLKNRKMGLGGYFLNDVAGHITQKAGYLSYSYIASMSNGMKLSFGLSAGILGYTLDGSKLNLAQSGDQVLSSGIQSSYVPDAGFGLYFYSKRLGLGFSANQLFSNKLKFFENGNVGSATLSRHYNVHVSYLIGSDESAFNFKPYLLVKYVDPVPAQLDMGLKISYLKNLWAGATYRTDDAISVLCGFNLRDNLVFGYSYDIVQSDIKVRAKASHELMLGLKIQRALPRAK